MSVAGTPAQGSAAFLTSDVEPIGGVIKQRPEDFLVEEVPLVEPAGEGEHTYLFVEKTNKTTEAAARIIARHFNVRRRDVGSAGLKDKHGITRQVFSVHTPGKKPEDFPEIRAKGVSVLWVDLHTNKLRTGQLRSNRFSVRIREVDPLRVIDANRALAQLAREGVPNFYGEQRFGARLNNHGVARKLCQGDEHAALDAMLAPAHGSPADDPFREVHARFVAGDLGGAAAALPRPMQTEKNILSEMIRGKPVSDAFRSIPRKELAFLFCALQSAVFNRVLAGRLAAGAMSGLVPGDLAYEHGTGRVIVVDEGSAGELNDRASRFEVSPSAPLIGSKTLWPAEGTEAHTREIGAVRGVGITPEQFNEANDRYRLGLTGERRPVRTRLTDPEIEGGADEHGTFIRVAFDLSPGGYATSVVRELSKNRDPVIG